MNLTIDGRPVAAEPGATILQAARAAGHRDPHPLPGRPPRAYLGLPPLRRRASRAASRPGDGVRHAGRRRHGRHHATEELRAIRQLNLELHAQRPHVVLHAALPRRLPHAHQDPGVPRAHRSARLRRRRCACCARTCRFPASSGACARGPARRPAARQLVEEPITICQLHRFMADQTRPGEQEGELLLPAEPKPDTGKRIADRRRRARRPRRRLLRPARRARRQDLRGACPSRAACSATASPATACRATVLDEELNILWRMGVELQTRRAPRRRRPARGPHAPSTTPCSSPWAPSTPTP